MARYVLRVFRDNVTGWVPTILVVAVVTTLVGICMNQFVWTSSPSFTLAARQAGLDPAEFGMVSVTIYVVVSLLAFFSLTVVGSATVNRIHGTFAQWRLMGASPSQVLASMWMLVGVASLFGSLIGSLAAVPASLLAVPEFNAMAAESFADGFGSFAPPAFTPSMAAWLGSLLLGVATCMLGASIPSLRAAKIRPIEVIRGTGAIGIRHGWRSWAHWALGLIVMAAALALAFSGMGTPRTLAFGQEAGQTFNSALWAGIIASFGMYILVSMLIPILLGIGRVVCRLCGSATGVLAARSAKAKAASNTNTIAPLALAMGLSVTLLTCARSYGRILALGGHPKSLNYADSLLLITMLCIVSLATSMAVIALSNRSMVADQALLRSIGLSPRRVIRMYLWQSLQLAAGAGRRYDADHHTRLHEAADHVHHRHDADRVRRDADASVRHDRPIEPALGLQRLMAVDGTVRLDRLDPLPGGAHPLRGRGAMVARRLYARRQLHAYDSGNPAARRLAACGVLCGAHGDADRRGVVA